MLWRIFYTLHLDYHEGSSGDFGGQVLNCVDQLNSNLEITLAPYSDALASLALMIVTHSLIETGDWPFLMFYSSVAICLVLHTFE